MNLRSLAFGAVAAAFVATPAGAFYVNGYAVSSQQSCGLGNLPGTVSELTKFFASHDFPDDLQKNFFWTDSRVRQSEWARGGDQFANTETSSGFDGADSGLITYIASHGKTAGGVYTALPGGAGGCAIKSTDLSLGDQAARYLVLSTCQGLKIGNGDQPTSAGENPSATWSAAGANLNCIFGYSNNMMDSDAYGDDWLHDLATTDDTLAEAFFHAAHAISFSNLPVALCSGTDEASARQHIETSKRFVADRFGAGASAFVYDMSKLVGAAYAMPPTAPTPRHLKLSPTAMPATKIARAILGPDLVNAAVGKDLSVWRPAAGKARLGLVTYDAPRGTLTWRAERIDLGTPMKLKDDSAIRVAKDFVKARGLVLDPDASLVPSYVIDRAATFSGKPAVVAKTVVLHQKFQDMLPLTTVGSVEVTIGADGTVVALRSRLVEVEVPNIVEYVDTSGFSLKRAQDKGLALVGGDHLGQIVRVLSTRVGYAPEKMDDGTWRLTASVEVEVEAEQGGFARRYARLLPL